ncbi:Uncharacterised protein [Helicobacter pylori]|nr:Uncharacterised protein [Helicobacter pylori]
MPSNALLIEEIATFEFQKLFSFFASNDGHSRPQDHNY